MRIKTKLVSSTAAVVLFAVLAVSLPLIFREVSTQEHDLESEATYMQQIVYSQVENFLAEPKTALDAMVSFAGSQDFTRESMTPFLQGIAAKNPDYQYVYYVDSLPYKDGGFVADNLLLEFPADFDQTSRSWFKAAAVTDDVIVTEPYLDIMVGGVVITLSERVMRNGRLFGVASIDIALDKIVNFTNSFSMTEHGRSYILNKDGLYITNDNSDKVLKDNFFDDNGIPQLKSRIASSNGCVTLDAGNGNYLIGSPLPKRTGWLFVSMGPASELSGAIRANVLFAVAVALVCIAIALVIGFVVSNTLVRPIAQVSKAVHGIAEGEADLTYRLNAGGNDEVGELVAGFNAFMAKLQSIIGALKQSKDGLLDAGNGLHESAAGTTSGIGEILSSMQNMEGGIANQAQSVDQTAGAVNEILSNIQSMERMVQTQAEGVSLASSAVEQMIGNISAVNSSVDKMASSFMALQDDAENGVKTQEDLASHVSDIEAQSVSLHDANTTIANIASQTNLLAMNAAIEAAHAGEAGKGFAVVADEIRKLSETSSAQSKTIGTQIKAIQDTITTVVLAAQKGAKGYAALSDEIRETDNIVRQIKAAMEEQNEGSKQIIEALRNMNDSTSEVRVASKEMAEGSQMILKEVRELQDASQSMKSGMEQMSESASGIKGASETLSKISARMEEAINQIGEQVDEFEV